MEKALIIQSKYIKDILFSSLIAKNLKKLLNYKVEVHFFCYEEGRSILLNNPYIDKIISFDDTKLKYFFEFYKIIKYLHSQNYSILIDPYARLQSRIITFFCRAKIKSSIKKTFFKILYTHSYKEKLNVNRYDCTVIENKLMLLNPFNHKNEILDDQINVFLTEKEKKNYRIILENYKILSKPIVMLGILGSSKKNSWPSKYMLNIIYFILGKYNYNILLNYMPHQEEEMKSIFFNSIEVNDKLFIKPLVKNVRDLAGFMYFCYAYIGNEGVDINIAKSLNIPTFSIYSPYKFRRDWGCYEKKPIHKSVHLKDICPNLYRNIYIKDLYKQTVKLYPKLKYAYVEDQLRSFFDKILYNYQK